jgi:hypothetical protein
VEISLEERPWPIDRSPVTLSGSNSRSPTRIRGLLLVASDWDLRRNQCP